MNTRIFGSALALITLSLSGCSNSDCITANSERLCDFGDNNYVTASEPANSSSGAASSQSVSAGSTPGLDQFLDDDLLFGAAMDEENNILGGPCEDNGLCYLGHLFLDSEYGEYFVDASIVLLRGGDIVAAAATCDSGEWGYDGNDLWFISEIDGVEWIAGVALVGESVSVGPLTSRLTGYMDPVPMCEVEFPIFGL